MNTDTRFATWLLRPYLDLAPARKGPLHARNVSECWRSFSEPASARYVPQRAMPVGFREELVRVLGDPRYAINEPRQLPGELHTPAWSEFCSGIDAWADLSTEQKCRLLILLHTLGFYGVASQLRIPADEADLTQDPGVAELQFWAASARFVLNLPTQENHPDNPDMSPFERLAIEGPRFSSLRVDSAIKVLVNKAKTGGTLTELQQWAAVLETTFQDAAQVLAGFRLGLLNSRYHRAMGFLPQRTGDKAQLGRVMELAEHHATILHASNETEHVLRLENLHAVLESRTKEALWVGDLDAALQRAQRLAEFDPCDSKALVELGQVHMRRKEWDLASRAYSTAAMMGPPASAVGRHMAGICFRQMGEDAMAALLFAEALEVDPWGISPRDEIRALASDPRTQLLKEWSRDSLPI